jgi:carbon-monoxide dehydrogenase large subunit
MVDIPQAEKRIDLDKKISGEAQFIDDISFQGMLHAFVLRSPHAHAEIVDINLDQALQVEGIEKIITGQDIKDEVINVDIGDHRPLAMDKVRFQGEPVAVVLSEDKWKAKKALNLIEVEYNPLEAVMNAREAIKEVSPLVHENQDQYDRHLNTNHHPGTNIFRHYKLRKGNVNQAFKNADKIIENTYDYPQRSHTQMEPHGAIAKWTTDQEMVMYASTQSPFFVRTTIADMFNISDTNIIVKAGYLGGGFGGKSDVSIEPLTAFIAKFVPNRYVKLKLDREEAFNASLIARGAEVTLKTAVTQNGKILGEKATLYFSSGAYGSTSVHIVTAAGHNSSGPYEIDNMEVDSYGVYTNTPPVGAFRGYGHPEVHWAKERQIHLIAKELGLNEHQVRLKNMLRPGSINALGQEIEEENGDLIGCYEKIKEKLDQIEINKKPGKVYGKGIAAIMKSPVMPTNSAASATLRFNEEGTVDIACSGAEMGQGTKTAMKQIAAAGLKLPLEKIKIKEDISTDNSPYGWQTIGSTTTWKAGRAVMDAIEKAIDKLKENAELLLDIEKDKLEYQGEKIVSKDNENIYVKTEDICFGHLSENGLVTGEPVQTYGTYMPKGLTYTDPETGQGNAAAEWTFGAQGVVIEIDKETGELKLLNMMMAIDAGKVISPKMARGQIIGGMVQEMGGALTEELKYGKNGEMRNNSFTDYKIPTPLDLYDADLDVYFFETPEPIGPFGARGIAEHGTVGITPAFGNAVSDALGIEMFELPLSREKIYLKMIEEGDLDV